MSFQLENNFVRGHHRFQNENRVEGFAVHVISRQPFNEAAGKYPNSALALLYLMRVLEKKTFNSPDEMKRAIPSLNNFKYRKKWWVIDVFGNTVRLMAFIDFEKQKVFVKHIATHAEYDKLTKYYREHKEWLLQLISTPPVPKA